MMERVLMNLIKKPKNYNYWLCLFLLLLVFIHSSWAENLNNILSYIIIFIVGEILIRISQFVEYCAIFYGKTDNYSKTLRDIFHWNNIALAVGITLITYTLLSPSEIIIHNKLALLLAYTFIRACKFDVSRYMKKIWIENSDGVDYGSGMAYSYFYGYLNIILPNKGDNNKSIKELMNIYEANQHITIAKHKLFLLIDKNLFIPPDLSMMSNKVVKMESCQTMLEITRNRAGVKNRPYKNTVYKLQENQEDKPYYVVAEGATPLLTLYETMNNRGEDHQNQDNNIDEIVAQFYRTLKNLLKTHYDCTDLCELIYFDSKVTNDVGELLLKRIKSE